MPLSDGVIEVVRITRQTKKSSFAAGSTLAMEIESPVVMLAGVPTSDTAIAIEPPNFLNDRPGAARPTALKGDEVMSKICKSKWTQR